MRRSAALTLLSPAFLLVVVVFLAPFALLVMISFWTQPAGSLVMQPDFSLEGYRKIVTDPFYLRALGRTIALALTTVVICIVIGFPTAVWIVRRSGSWRRLCMALLLLPMVCGALLPALGLVNLLSPLGVVNSLLKSAGVIDKAIPFLGTLGGILIGLVQSFVPLMILPIIAVLDRMPYAYEEAAMSLGAKPAQVWRRVVLPLASPGVLAGSVLVFCAALTSFVTPQVLGQGKISTFAALSWQQAAQVLDWPFASALAVVMLLMMAALAGLVALLRRALSAETGSAA